MKYVTKEEFASAVEEIKAMIDEKFGDKEEPEEVEAAETDAPEEDIEVEVATVEVDDKLDDDEETEEISPRTSNLPSVMQRKSYAFIS